MPYDTYLTGADQFDRTYQPDMTPTDPSVYGSLPGDVSRDQAAQKAARKRQILTALAAGLAAPRQGGGFLGGLAAGFSGAVQGSQAYADKTQEVERQRVRDEAANRQRQEADVKWQLMFQRQRASDEEAARHNRATEGRQGNMSELEYFLKDQAGYQRFKELGRAPGENQDVGLALTPDAMNLISDQYVATGQMPPFGMGKAGSAQRAKVYNRAAERHPGESVATNQASFRANSAALGKMETGLANTEAYISSIDKNLAVLEQTINSVPETNTRLGNRFMRALASHTGSQEMAQFNTALQVVIPELAQINSQGFLSNGSRLTDSARHDIGSVLHGDYTRKQLRSALAILRQDSQNKLTSGRAQVEKIRGRIGSGITQDVGEQFDPEAARAKYGY